MPHGEYGGERPDRQKDFRYGRSLHLRNTISSKPSGANVAARDAIATAAWLYANSESLSLEKIPKVTVVIPTWNRASLVLEAIESVLLQDYRDFEIVVVSDGSTDETASRLQPLIDAKQIRFFEQPNSGQSVARNRGLTEARGQYIAFLDDDDPLACRPAGLAGRIPRPAPERSVRRWPTSDGAGRNVNAADPGKGGIF